MMIKEFGLWHIMVLHKIQRMMSYKLLIMISKVMIIQIEMFIEILKMLKHNKNVVMELIVLLIIKLQNNMLLSHKHKLMA